MTEDEREYLAAATTGTTLSFWAARQPDVPAITSTHGEQSFRSLDQDANRMARVFREAGLGPGDGVAVLLPNRPELVVTYYAALRSGLRFTPLNWHLGAEEIAYILVDSGARALVADSRFGAAAAAAVRTAPGVRLRMVVDGEVPEFAPFDRLVTAASPDALEGPVRGRWMFYTSGTTGRPKGVLRPLPPPSVDGMRGNTNRPGEISPADMRRLGVPDQRMQPGVSRHLCTGPLYHAGPLNVSLTVPLAAGVGVVLMDEWSAEETLRLIEAHRITHSHMVPTMFHRLLALPEEVRTSADVSSLEYVWHGAANCPVAVKRAMIDWWGPVLLEYYAATEGPVTYVDSHQWLQRPGTVGRPISADKVTIRDAEGNILPANQPGTIWIKVPEGRGFEYLNSPEKTKASYHGSSYTLGDVGYLDEDGYLFLTDRSADLIISGGVNIYPAEVEAVLIEHPEVGDVAVIGVPDDEWGESVLAVVEPAAGVIADDRLASELIAHCRARIAHFKCPRRVEFVTALPRTDAGKLSKVQLRATYRELAVAPSGRSST